jgi:putative hydrolase of the HAD superfamily
MHLGIISNWDERLRPLLQEIGLAQWFDSLTISCEVGTEKHDARIFQAALRAAGVSAWEAMHVGDSYGEDVCGAEAVGMRAVLLKRNGENTYGCVGIRDLTELLKILAA